MKCDICDTSTKEMCACSTSFHSISSSVKDKKKRKELYKLKKIEKRRKILNILPNQSGTCHLLFNTVLTMICHDNVC